MFMAYAHTHTHTHKNTTQATQGSVTKSKKIEFLVVAQRHPP